MERDYNISIIRIFSMLSIVLCHIFQMKNMGIAFYLNVAVQVFLFMSGFLYGKKDIDDSWLWLKRQIKKIIIPYYIYIIIALIMYVLFARQFLTIKNVLSMFLCQQLILSFPQGLNHLWFIPVILICYLITPFLNKILKNNNQKQKNLVLIIIIFYIEVMFYQTSIDVRICNMICYILGYAISSETNKKNQNNILLLIYILTIITNFTKIFVVPDSGNEIIDFIINLFIKNSHILLGSTIFIIFYKTFGIINISPKKIILKVINILDKYCMYVYITHHVFIAKPLSLINLTNSIFLNLLIIVICIVGSSWLLEKIVQRVRKEIKYI